MARNAKVVKVEYSRGGIGAFMAAVAALGAASFITRRSRAKRGRSGLLKRALGTAATAMAVGELVAPRAYARILALPRTTLAAWRR